MTVVDKSQAPKKLRLELVRKVEGQAEPIVIKSKQINKTDEIILFPRMKPMGRAFFVNAIIKRETQVPRFILGLIHRGSKTKVEYVVRFNQYFSEALTGLTETIPQFSQELSNLLLSDDEKQHVDGVAKISKFVLDDTTIKLILVVFAISIPFGLLMDNLLHLIPNQIIDWGP